MAGAFVVVGAFVLDGAFVVVDGAVTGGRVVTGTVVAGARVVVVSTTVVAGARVVSAGTSVEETASGVEGEELHAVRASSRAAHVMDERIWVLIEHIVPSVTRTARDKGM